MLSAEGDGFCARMRFDGGGLEGDGVDGDEAVVADGGEGAGWEAAWAA